MLQTCTFTVLRGRSELPGQPGIAEAAAIASTDGEAPLEAGADLPAQTDLLVGAQMVFAEHFHPELHRAVQGVFVAQPPGVDGVA